MAKWRANGSLLYTIVSKWPAVKCKICIGRGSASARLRRSTGPGLSFGSVITGVNGSGRAEQQPLGIKASNPVRYCGAPPEVSRLAVMPDFGFSRSLRNPEGLLHACGVDVGSEIIRYWQERMGTKPFRVEPHHCCRRVA